MKNARLTLVTVALAVILVGIMGLVWTGCNRSVDTTNSSVTTLQPSQQLEQSLEAAMAVQDRHTDELLAISGVVGTGTGLGPDGNPVIKVFVNGTTNGVAKIADKLEGIPVEVEETGPVTALSLTARYRPVPIGVSVGNNLECAAGTIGCVIYKSNQKYILSNNHVLARENKAAIGEDIVQPGRYDTKCADNLATDKVADLSDFEPIKFDGTNNYIDAAIALYSTTDVTCATLAGFYGYPGTTIVNPAVSLAIKKVGRTTELTTGTISSINVTVNVGYSTGTAKFVGCFMTTKKFTKAGDSGSLVVTNSTANSPVGLLFAGTNLGQAICCPITPVLSRFGATICTQ
ncbi:hypothetical protein C3F09_06495 [candidate division GN15 bacterium]|uniref:Serine protease n=1 Tax=candidate division GN15 bacterium TaxID=2072418 RepID=A0A855X7J1_9BACT|nr:MAG: hypothetical protein C3F09_06495 [candidate division GN15 bacterium]